MDNLPNQDTASAEDYNAAVENLLNGSSESTTPEEVETEVTEEVANEEVVEQSQSEEEVDESEQLDEEVTEEDGQEDTVDSTDEVIEEDDKEATIDSYDFNAIPMDEIMPFEIKAGGQVMHASMDQLIEGFKKGIGFTKNMQQIKPFSRSIGIMEKYGITENDLTLLAEGKSGSKEAFARMMVDAKVDSVDVDTEGNENYTPKDPGVTPIDHEMEQVKSEINSDTEYFPAMKQAITDMPQDFYDLVNNEPQALNNLYNDVKGGIYQQIMPEVIKQQMLGSKEPTVDLYIKVANKMFSKETAEQNMQKTDEVKEDQTKAKQVSKDKRKAAGSGTKVKANKQTSVSAKLDDMDSDEFAASFEKMTGMSMSDLKDI